MGLTKIKLPTEIPLEIYPKPMEFVEEAKSIVEEAEKRGIIMRVMGGLAIYLLISGTIYEELWGKMERLGERVFTDIDLAAYGRDRDKILRYFMEREKGVYIIWQPSLAFYAGKRYIFYGSPEKQEYKGKIVGRIPMIEVFFDKLQMNHEVPFKGRLEKGKYTLPPTELLLTKLQIVKINEKDIKDSIILLSAFDVLNSDNEINGDYIAKLLSNDWGFYYTFTTNLNKVKEAVMNKYNDRINEELRIKITERIEKLIKRIEEEPKSMSWKMRAKIGTSKKWYNEVEEWS
ncbi:MAG: hypothetical protein QW743_01875 [Candidatus Methanomethylicia archaeon]